ncbi:RHS repeat-associated core domain-containing protein [Sphaerisporangium dianthi]|uniref:alpha-amylase n=1 Tax=Sphaerisporangium dianthi TaxID=1436120 RepID=A0ABV9CFS7_9ACTN
MSFAWKKLSAVLVGLAVVATPLPAQGQSRPPEAARPVAAPAHDDTSRGSPAVGPSATEAVARAAADPAGPSVYAYDAAGKLAGVTHPGGEAARYTYDEAGNMLGVERYPATRLSVMSLVPVAARPGASVSLQGTGFSTTASGNAVSFNGAAATVTAATATTLTVTVPAGATTGPVTVTTGGTTEQAGAFTLAPAGPVITSLSPASGPPTTEVTITGSGFAPGLPDNVVTINGTPAEVVSATATTLKIVVPTRVATGRVQVSTSAGDAVSAADFTIPLPEVDSATIETAARVQVGGAAQNFLITTAGRSALAVFDAPASGNVDIGLTGITLGGLYAEAYDYGGERIANQYIGSSDAVHLSGLTEGRTYQLLIDPTSATATGQITVTMSEPVDGGVLSPTGAGSTVGITRAGQAAVFTFAGTTGAAVSLGLTSNTLNKSAYVNVWAPDGRLVTRDFYLSAGSADGVDIGKLPATGTYRVVVAPNSAGTGSITVTLSSPVSGGTLSPTGAGTVAAISRPGQDAVFTFDGVADGAVSLGLTSNTLNKSAYVNVWAPDGTLVARDFYLSAGSADGVDIGKLPATGTYRVVVAPNSAGTGSITVTLSNPVNGGTLSPTGAGTVAAISRPGQDAVFTFAGTAGGAAGLGLTANTLTKTAYVNVWAPDGTLVARDFYLSAGSADELDIGRLPATGTYRVAISPNSAGTGSITVTLSNPVNGGTLSPTGAGTAAAIARAGQDAVFAFDGATGAAVSLGIVPNTVNQPMYVNVIAPDGTTSVVRDYYVSAAAADEIDIAKLPQTGTYKVVLDPTKSGTGSATVTFSDRVAAGALTLGAAAKSATIARAGQDAAYTFTGTAAQKVQLSVTGVTSFGAAVYVGVYKPDGTSLGNSYVSANQVISVADLPAAGTYTVVVDPTKGATGQVGMALATRTALAPKDATGGAGGPSATSAAASATSAAPTAGTASTTGAAPTAAPGTSPAAEPPSATLAGEKPAAGDADWKPDKGNLRGVDWNIRRAEPKPVTPLQAATGTTALSGVIRTVDGRPLPRVALAAGRVKAATDTQGRFLLAGLPSGTVTLDVDGAPASAKGHRYGFYSVKVDLAAGRTTVLPYTIWMQQLDTQHMVRFDSPASAEVVLTTPKIPGLEVRIPKGSVIRDKSGKVLTELGITPIPIDRPPFPLPPNGIVPVYFTVQPGGTFVFPDGARVVYPNYTKLPPGHTVDFWNYDPERQGWHVYGHGKVSADATQVVPDPGTKLWSFHGGMFNTSLIPKWLTKWFKDVWDWVNGDPVQLSTGQLMDSRTDLAVDDVMPIEVTRTLYQGDTFKRGFGIGQIGEYDSFLHSEEQYQEVDLYLPGGAVIHYVRTYEGTGYSDAEFAARDTPGAYRGSTIVRDGDGWTLTRRDGMRFYYPQYKPLAEIKDRNGNKITLTRDAELNLVQITSPNSRWIRLAYDTQDRVTGLRDNIGRTVGYTYNAGGRLETVTDPAGKTMRYTYDAAGRLYTATDTRGIVYMTNEYDSAGRVKKQTLTDGQVYTFDYVTDPGTGAITETRVTQPGGAVQRATFNAAGAVTAQTEAYGTPEARTTVYTRGADQRIDSSTDPEGRVTAYAYDGEGRVKYSTRLAGTPDAVDGEKVVYGPFDQPAAITDELGKTTTYDFDADGNVVKETDPLGRVVKTTYNKAGQVLTVTDAALKVTTNAYRLGALRTTTDPTGRVTRFFADAAGRVTHTTDPAGAVAVVAYDARNQISSATDPLGHAYAFEYDDNGNRTKLTDPRHNSINWEYDGSDRVKKVTDPLGRSSVTTYNPAGQVDTITGRSGKVTKFTYDALDRTKTVDYGVTATGAESRVVLTYEGDLLKKISDTAAGGDTTFTYDTLDRVKTVAAPTGQVGYGYDAADRRTSVTVQGRTPVIYDYDDTGAVKRVARGTVEAVPHYDDAGRQDSLALPGGWSQAYGYDDAGRVTSISYRYGGAAKGDLAYGYDPLGQIASVTGSFAKVALPAAADGMVYDAANRMTGRAGQTLSYDLDGNLTGDGATTYTWNARGQLTGLSRAGLTAGFRYDGEGRRDRRTVNGAVTGYLSAGDNPVAETDASGAVTADLLSGAVDRWLGRTTASGTQTYLTDLQGSTLALGASDGAVKASYSYDPYGGAAVTGDPGGNGFTYTGREDDGTGLMFNRARYYSPTLGRFLSEDQVGIDGGANLYGYAAGDPVNATDPSGNNPLLVACAGGALFGGGLEYLTQRLSGRKVEWGAVGTQAALGCGLGMLGKAFQLGKLAQCVGNSFTGDTPVLMADGTRKPISEVKVGERVTVTDPATGVTRGEPVTAVIQGVGPKALVHITVDLDGDRGTATGAVTATDGHPFWVPEQGGWVEAQDLVPGTWLRTSAGTYLQVSAVRTSFQWQRVHNLTVGDTHTYYVGAGGQDVLVHNGACPKAAWLGKANFTSPKTMSKKFDAHAADFGITGTRNKANLKAFEKAMRDHIAAPGTKIYRFDYRGQGIAVGFIDPSSGKMVMLHADGTFWSAFNLGRNQLASVIDKGFLW